MEVKQKCLLCTFSAKKVEVQAFVDTCSSLWNNVLGTVLGGCSWNHRRFAGTPERRGAQPAKLPLDHLPAMSGNLINTVFNSGQISAIITYNASELSSTHANKPFGAAGYSCHRAIHLLEGSGHRRRVIKLSSHPFHQIN